MNKKLKIMIDIDGTITYAPSFFSLFTNAMRAVAEIHIVTSRTCKEDPDYRTVIEDTRKELVSNNIYYNRLVATFDKVEYCKKTGISIVFEDTDEVLIKMPETVTCFKIRESMNFCWDSMRWLHSDKTSQDVTK